MCDLTIKKAAELSWRDLATASPISRLSVWQPYVSWWWWTYLMPPLLWLMGWMGRGELTSRISLTECLRNTHIPQLILLHLKGVSNQCCGAGTATLRWSRSRPNLVGAGVGSGTSDIRSRPKSGGSATLSATQIFINLNKLNFILVMTRHIGRSLFHEVQIFVKIH